MASDSASMNVSVSAPGDTCSWTLRQVVVSYGGASDCLPLATGTITGAEPPPPPEPLPTRVVKFVIQAVVQVIVNRYL